MIATSRKSRFPVTVTRRLEFSRLQSQRLASAYEALIPVVSARLNRIESRHYARTAESRSETPRSSAVGA
jgi:hypothetical protein